MAEQKEKLKCGIVMPISSMSDYTESHWSDVLEIITTAIEDAEFEGDLVSNADETGIIHKRIIQNLYDNPMVVCDVSGKNPNVMFELGLRLAFDKPTIIVKDDKTSYTFDTSSIEHIEYPKDLRFSQIVEFKKTLTEKIIATYKKSTEDSSYTTFLKHFGTFHVAKLESTEVTGDQLILDELQDLRKSISVIRRSQRKDSRDLSRRKEGDGLASRLVREMKLYVQERGLKGKVQIRKNKSDIQMVMEDMIDAPLHFDSPREYEMFFNDVFDAIYGQ